MNKVEAKRVACAIIGAHLTAAPGELIEEAGTDYSQEDFERIENAIAEISSELIRRGRLAP